MCTCVFVPVIKRFHVKAAAKICQITMTTKLTDDISIFAAVWWILKSVFDRTHKPQLLSEYGSFCLCYCSRGHKKYVICNYIYGRYHSLDNNLMTISVTHINWLSSHECLTSIESTVLALALSSLLYRLIAHTKNTRTHKITWQCWKSMRASRHKRANKHTKITHTIIVWNYHYEMLEKCAESFEIAANCCNAVMSRLSFSDKSIS